jgi:predicted CXXCH cytochrome family protein
VNALLLSLALAAPELLTPVDQTTRAQVRLYAASDAGTVWVTVGGLDAGSCESGGARKDVAHCTVPLTVGANEVVFSDSSGGVATTVRYYPGNTPLVPGVDTLSFGAHVLHEPAVEKRCEGCHAMHEAEERDAGVSLLGTTCTGCHQSLLTRKTIHGPVGQGQCTACHDPRSAPGRYAVRWPMQETCFKCHADIKGAMWTKAYRHGPAAAGRCTTCHDPHGSENPYWLKKKPYDLCTWCHTEKRTERHVVVGFVFGDSHPLYNRPHPLKPNVEFACPACHNPHAAQARFLWQFDATTRETLCRSCHAK